MNIKFEWNEKMASASCRSLENKITKDLTGKHAPEPCHSGDITVSMLSSSTEKSVIAGKINCSCGRTYISFAGLLDGRKIYYHQIDIS